MNKWIIRGSNSDPAYHNVLVNLLSKLCLRPKLSFFVTQNFLMMLEFFF